MGKRVSHSLLDPYLTGPLKRIYTALPIPRWLPPEAIVGIGHLCAIVAGIGFAFSTQYWWAALFAALGVAGNHIADVLDGTHARATEQCRNGGELLDHFADPLSFSYYIVGFSISCGEPLMGSAGVICIYATAVLTNIKAKLTGEFELARFGPTEFKTLLVVYALGLAAFVYTGASEANIIALWSLAGFLGVGILQLIVNLYLAVIEVNKEGPPADTTEWELDQD